MGVAFFKGSYSALLYPRLFCLYYVTQALVLLLQCKADRKVDLIYGVSATFTFRLGLSILLLAVSLAVFPLAVTS